MQTTPVFPLLILLSVPLAAVSEPTVPVARDAADSAARVRRTLAAGPATMRDLAEDEPGALFAGDVAAPAGRYRLHAPVAVHPLGDPATAWLMTQLRAGNAERTFNVLSLAAADEFADLTLDFMAQDGETPVAVHWTFEGKHASVARARSTETPTEPGFELSPEALDDETEVLDDLEGKDSLRPIERARLIKTCLMLREVHVEPLSPVAIAAVRTDKITYKRGEQGRAMVELHNAGAAPQTVSLAAEVVGGLERKWPVRTETVSVPAGGVRSWEATFGTEAMEWGCALHVAATVDGFPPETGTAVFSVPNHFWDVAIMGTCPAQMTRGFASMAAARQAAAQLREQGYTGFEAYFWAPCDFLDYTPETERFFSGQTAYVQSIAGTRNLIAACHELGIAATFYANLWGGSGEPAFEVMRRHPDWFGHANFHSGALDDAALMTAGIIRGPGHKVWSYNQLNDRAGMGLFDYHVEEILGARRMFGWDGIRYDSYYSAAWTIKAMTHIRERMRKEVPEFLFGYNAFADAEYRAGAMDSLSGGMVMAEGLRIGPGSRVLDYVRALDSWRAVAWPYGAAIGPLYGFTGGPEGAQPSPLDHILVASAILAAGAHPYYNRLGGPTGEHPAFALRYAELLFDTRQRNPRDPDRLVKFPDGVDPLAWRALLRTVSPGGDRRRLVLHVLNIPEDATLGDLAMRCARPLRNVPVRFELPEDSTVSGAWLLQAVPGVSQHPLPVAAEGRTVMVTLPEVRFYGVVVLEFTAKTPIPEALDAKTARDYQRDPIRDWWVIGPFPSDAKLSGFDAVYPPEKGVDLKAAYKGIDGKETAWSRRPRPAPTSVDFVQQWPGAPATAVAYAWTRLVSDRERDVWLYTGSDDTLTVWWNGEKALSLKTARPVVADSERTKVRLKKGVNTALVKVCQLGGGWGFVMRLGDENGRPAMNGVTVVSKGSGM